MTALLERGHANVTVAESGADALVALEQVPDIDIVLMDIMMPVMDGYETMRAIRAIDRFKSLPIIAVTAKAAAGERQRCIDAGASDYVPKPVDTAGVIAALRAWLPATPSLPGPLEPAGVLPDRAAIQRPGAQRDRGIEDPRGRRRRSATSSR